VTVELAIAVPPAPRPAAVLVSDRPALRRQATAGLEVAGFSVVPVVGLHELGGRPAVEAVDLVVLVLGAEAQPRVRAVAAAAQQRSGVPILTTMPAAATGAQLRKALHAGASGVVLDDRVALALGPSARAVAAGQITMPPLLARRVAPKVLSHREKEILDLVALGLTNRQIADRLFVAESTVKSHLSSSLHKLDVRSRAEAVALILDPEEGYALAPASPHAADRPATGGVGARRKIEPMQDVESA
jgi:DNA-binding NarL/FixJ family response regulator